MMGKSQFMIVTVRITSYGYVIFTLCDIISGITRGDDSLMIKTPSRPMDRLLRMFFKWEMTVDIFYFKLYVVRHL